MKNIVLVTWEVLETRLDEESLNLLCRFTSSKRLGSKNYEIFSIHHSGKEGQIITHTTYSTKKLLGLNNLRGKTWIFIISTMNFGLKSYQLKSRVGIGTIKLNFWGNLRLLSWTQNLVKFYMVKKYFWKFRQIKI